MSKRVCNKMNANARSVKGTLSVMMLLSATALGVVSCGGGASRAGMGMPVGEYAVMTVETSSSDLNNAYPATIRGIQDVEIRPQVSGYITKLCVDEGATVRKGQALFQIDRVQYEAAVRQAEAAVKQAEAQEATAKLAADNTADLARQNIVGDFDLKKARNDLRTAQANLAAAQAQLTSARQNLGYTTVTSPSDGVVGTFPYRVGSLVSPSSAQALTTVSDISKMYVYFSMTEKQLLDLTRQGGTVKQLLAAMPAVELQLVDGTVYPEKGRIESLSGVIDPTTGAASMRAVFPNEKNILRSGGTGNVLVPNVLNDVILIPQKATTEMQDKKFVYVVSDSSTLTMREITISPLDNGAQYVVTGGLTPGEKIVVEGVATLREGMKITPKGTAAAAAQSAAGKEGEQAAAPAAAAEQKDAGK